MVKRFCIEVEGRDGWGRFKEHAVLSVGNGLENTQSKRHVLDLALLFKTERRLCVALRSYFHLRLSMESFQILNVELRVIVRDGSVELSTTNGSFVLSFGLKHGAQAHVELSALI
jgi:hypothetical protein